MIYQGDVREQMKGLRGTELAIPFHPLYTPWGPSSGEMIRKMAHRIGCHMLNLFAIAMACFRTSVSYDA